MMPFNELFKSLVAERLLVTTAVVQPFPDK
jgi:hypothetical protein